MRGPSRHHSQSVGPTASPAPEFFPARRAAPILFLGQPDPKKGLDLLLLAFARVRVEYSSAELVIAGSGGPGYTARLVGSSSPTPPASTDPLARAVISLLQNAGLRSVMGQQKTSCANTFFVRCCCKRPHTSLRRTAPPGGGAGRGSGGLNITDLIRTAAGDGNARSAAHGDADAVARCMLASARNGPVSPSLAEIRAAEGFSQSVLTGNMLETLEASAVEKSAPALECSRSTVQVKKDV